MQNSISPYRVEWSMFDDHCRITGQEDALCFDMDHDNCLALTDWTRTKQKFILKPYGMHDDEEVIIRYTVVQVPCDMLQQCRGIG